MKKYNKLVVVFFLITAFFGCKTTPVYEGKVLIRETDMTKVIELKTGETAYIKLKSRLSTGYGWTIKSAPACITFAEKTDVETDESGQDGAVDYQILHFTATTAGEGEIILEYLQPWEKEVKAERSLKFKVSVKE